MSPVFLGIRTLFPCSWIITDTNSFFLLNNGFYFSLNKFNYFIITLKTYTVQFKCRIFSKHASKTRADSGDKTWSKTWRIFIITTLGKQSLKQKQSQSRIDFCSTSQTKLSHKTTDAALKILQNLTTNSSLFADQPNSPGEGCRESPRPQARRGTKELFLLPGDDTEDDSPQKNVPHVGVPILQSNIAPASPPRTMGMAQLGTLTAHCSANPTPPTSARWWKGGQVPPKILMLCSFSIEAHKASELNYEYFNPGQECPLG